MKRRNRPVALLIGLNVIIPIIIIGLLCYFSNASQKISRFNRNYNSSKLEEIKRITTQDSIIGLIGVVNNEIYWQTKDPRIIVLTDTTVSNKRYKHFSIPQKIVEGAIFEWKIDDRFAYLFPKNSPFVAVYDIESMSLINLCNVGSLYTRNVGLNHGTLILRSYQGRDAKINQVFQKQRLNSKTVKYNNVKWKFENDAGMSSDGLLQYDPLKNLLTYVQFYDCNYYVIDTNLNIIGTGRTIDRHDLKQNYVKRLTTDVKNSELTNTAPPLVLNKFNYVYDGVLYNISRMQSENDTKNDMDESVVVDIYNLTNNRYTFSFRIPNYNNEMVKQFAVINDKIISIYKSMIIVYKI